MVQGNWDRVRESGMGKGVALPLSVCGHACMHDMCTRTTPWFPGLLMVRRAGQHGGLQLCFILHAQRLDLAGSSPSPSPLAASRGYHMQSKPWQLLQQQGTRLPEVGSHPSSTCAGVWGLAPALYSTQSAQANPHPRQKEWCPAQPAPPSPPAA